MKFNVTLYFFYWIFNELIRDWVLYLQKFKLIGGGNGLSYVAFGTKELKKWNEMSNIALLFIFLSWLSLHGLLKFTVLASKESTLLESMKEADPCTLPLCDLYEGVYLSHLTVSSSMLFYWC